MAVFTQLSSTDAHALTERFALGNLTNLRGIAAGSVNSNYRLDTSSGAYFVRVYEERDRAGAEADAALLATIAPRVPTPAPRPDMDGVRVAVVRDKPVAVFPWIEGRSRCQASVSASDAREVGRALARMHVACADVDAGAGRFEIGDVRARLARIARDSVFAGEAAHLERRLEAWSARRDPSLPRGFIHGDLFRDNVLFDDAGALVALLDFESASLGVLAYDLMVTVLAWCYGDAFDHALVRAMIGGYESVRPLEPRERAALVVEGCIAALRFTATRITDYAQRGPSDGRVMKDWRRFRARLDALEGGYGLQATGYRLQPEPED